ncbi:MAG TPA: methyltransferase [Nanoarchaeota archaeon]|nr:methyltransferase [Nanoarchaeota archaeon]
MNQKQLAVMLSGLAPVKERSAKLEQYPTDSEIAAEVLWNAFLQGDIEGRAVADFGCGSGILGVGALLLGAEKAAFIDIDSKSIETAKENVKSASKAAGKKLNADFFNVDVTDFKGGADVVLQNPPFGTKQEHADKAFLLKAMETAGVVYSFHKASTEKFVNSVAKDNGFQAAGRWLFRFPIRQSFRFHTKKVFYADVGCYRLVKE